MAMPKFEVSSSGRRPKRGWSRSCVGAESTTTSLEATMQSTHVNWSVREETPDDSSSRSC